MNVFEDLVKQLRGVKRYTAGTVTDLIDAAADAIELLNDYALEYTRDCGNCEIRKKYTDLIFKLQEARLNTDLHTTKTVSQYEGEI